MNINKKFIIKDLTGKELQSVIFYTQESLDDFKNILIKNEPWGKLGSYTAEEVDITAQVEAERIAKETKASDRVIRVTQLKAIDWNAITTIAGLKAVVKLLAEEALKDDE